MGTPSATHEVLMRMAFGDSSSASDGSSECDSPGRGHREAASGHLLIHSEVPGLYQVKGFLSEEQQAAVLAEAGELGWLDDPSTQNQVMHFGELPHWLLNAIQAAGMHLYTKELWPQEIADRSPTFDQFITNLYERGDGISSHVDLLRFQDGIANLSFLSSCIMTFTKQAQQPSELAAAGDPSAADNGTEHKVLLEPGDLLLLHGDARYKWAHGIKKCVSEQWGQETIQRDLRMSITLRRLCIS